MSGSRIVLALDGLSMAQAVELTKAVGERVYAVKIHNLVDEYGPKAAVDLLRRVGAARVWIDYKLHDIPATVEARARELAAAGANIITAHASGGVDMLKAAVRGAGSECEVFAISALTSLSEEEVGSIYGMDPEGIVSRLALLAAEAGVHGLVCSPKEVGMLSLLHELRDLKLVTPGVRSPGVSADDQKRIGTPRGAIQDGASLLVIGRQIIGALDPMKALEDIESEIAGATQGM